MARKDRQPYVDTPRWNIGFGTDAWFQRTFGAKWSQRGAKLVAVVVVVSVLCFALGVGIGKATAAGAATATAGTAGTARSARSAGTGSAGAAPATGDGVDARAQAPLRRCVDMHQEPCRRAAAKKR